MAVKFYNNADGQIGTRLKKIRESMGASQAEVARRLGVNQAALSYWENGAKKFPEERIVQVCLELGLNENWLRTGEGTAFTSSDVNMKALQEYIVSFIKGLPYDIKSQVTLELIKDAL